MKPMARGEVRTAASRRSVVGFTYPMLLVVVAVLGLGLARLGPVWEQADRRERERELMRVGELYAIALASARREAPGSQAGYPARLEDLVLDARFAGTRRHLRRLYPDPLQPGRPWALVRDSQGAIIGVHSQDTRQPLTQVAVERGLLSLPVASRYSDWIFGPKELLAAAGRPVKRAP